MGRPNVLHPLLDNHAYHCENTQISFSVEPVTEHTDLTQSSWAQPTPNEATRQLIDIADLASDPAVCEILLNAECFAPLLEKMQLFASIAEKFADIHPYAKAAWTIISAVVKLVAGRILLSHNVKTLLEVMDDAYSFVSKANKLERIESNRKIISALSKHTADCARFIERIVGKTDFEKTIFAPATEAKIKDYIARFEVFKTSLQQRACIQAAIVVHEM
ncbi:hypothetical protein BS17DRAFT_815460 [Gyrodon lividus]|nr:hypothetical protein BS17DRAFT_815460 [Gyrodon lividus]